MFPKPSKTQRIKSFIGIQNDFFTSMQKNTSRRDLGVTYNVLGKMYIESTMVSFWTFFFFLDLRFRVTLGFQSPFLIRKYNV